MKHDISSERCTALECLPVCPTHGEQMILQKARTPEQEFCGTWYRCPQCANSVLIPSKELTAQRKRNA